MAQLEEDLVDYRAMGRQMARTAIDIRIHEGKLNSRCEVAPIRDDSGRRRGIGGVFRSSIRTGQRRLSEAGSALTQGPQVHQGHPATAMAMVALCASAVSFLVMGKVARWVIAGTALTLG